MNKLILIFCLTFFPIFYSNSILGDSYYDSPESYVGSIAQETLYALNMPEEEIKYKYSHSGFQTYFDVF